MTACGIAPTVKVRTADQPHSGPAQRPPDLELRHLIERSVDPGHKRRNIVTLTPEGVEQLRQFLTLMSRLLDDPGPDAATG